MMAKRTIPENPAPGECYAEKVDDRRWFVQTLIAAGPESKVAGRLEAIVFTEADARRLLYCDAAVAACRLLDKLDWCAGYEMVQHDELQEALDAARAALTRFAATKEA